MKKAHFIGISGIGMSATAKLLKDLGWSISGSDLGFYPPASDYLKEHDIELKKGYKPDNIPEGVELIVIGKNAKLVKEENVEVETALESGVAVRSFAEVLGGLAEETKNIVVAGSYGKSTCSALLAWCLLSAKKDPSYFIGAIPLNTKETAGLGKSDTFIIEGDEYPSANWDSTSKFLYYNPRDVLLTSAAHDHVNIFPTHTDYLAPFKTLLSIIPEDGLLVACADDESSLALAHTHPGRTVLYGVDNKEALWSVKNIKFGETTRFELTKNGETVVELSTKLLGKHNIENIIGVSTMLLEKELLTPEELVEGVKTFEGVARRLDKKTEESTVAVYEGFGSSYEKARAGIEALKTHFPDKKLIVIFEPHTFSWRNKDAIDWYDSVFEGSELVLVYEPASQGAETHKQLTQEEIVERIQKAGVRVEAVHNSEDALAILEKELTGDEVILLSTSGDLGGMIKDVPRFVEKKFPKNENT